LLGVHASYLVTGMFYNVVTFYAIFILIASFKKKSLAFSQEK